MKRVSIAYMANSDVIREHAPEGTSGQRKQFISKSQGPNGITLSVVDSNQVRNNKRDGGVDKHQKGDGKWTDTKQVG